MCTLAPNDLIAHLAEIDALAADGLLERTPTHDGVRVRLRDAPEIERRTRAIVAAESDCCAFLDFRLGRGAGELVLDITGPAEARPLIERFFA